MEKLYDLTFKQLFRGILKNVRVYPSTNRELFRQAIIEEIHKYGKETDEDEIRKNMKRMRMIYAHCYMYKCKVDEINSNTLHIIGPGG